jgi:glutathione S-transferase
VRVKLLITKTSPFARKAWAASIELGLGDTVEPVFLEARLSMQAKPDLEPLNPLGKVPVLLLDDGQPLVDSRVIVAYLDALAGGGGLIAAGPERWGELMIEALADGMMEAGIVLRLETVRPEAERRPEMIAEHLAKIARTLDTLEADPPACDRFHVGKLALICAIDWLSYRQLCPQPLAGRPGLAAMHRQWAERACLVDTAP